MAVVFDAVATAQFFVNNQASPADLTGLTVGAGANRALVVQIIMAAAPTGVTVTWDQGGTNQSCPLIVRDTNTTGGSMAVSLYGLVAPTSGAKTLRVAWTAGGNTDLVFDVVSWTGVDQTGGVTSFPNSTSAKAASGSPTVAVTSATGDAAMNVSANDASAFSAQNQTSVFLDNGPNTFSTAGARAAGAATVTFIDTDTNGNWVAAGTSIKAAGGGGAVSVPYQPLYLIAPVLAQ